MKQADDIHVEDGNSEEVEKEARTTLIYGKIHVVDFFEVYYACPSCMAKIEVDGTFGECSKCGTATRVAKESERMTARVNMHCK